MRISRSPFLLGDMVICLLKPELGLGEIIKVDIPHGKSRLYTISWKVRKLKGLHLVETKDPPIIHGNIPLDDVVSESSFKKMQTMKNLFMTAQESYDAAKEAFESAGEVLHQLAGEYSRTTAEARGTDPRDEFKSLDMPRDDD